VTEPQRIFISYRREQTAAHAGRIFDRLTAAFGEQAVFMDVDSIGVGMDFTRALEDAVSSCAVMLVLIGPGWAEIAGRQGGRLDDPDDYVRQEIEAGLARDIRVIPVLLSGAVLPRPEELPEGLRPLVRRQTFSLPDELLARWCTCSLSGLAQWWRLAVRRQGVANAQRKVDTTGVVAAARSWRSSIADVAYLACLRTAASAASRSARTVSGSPLPVRT
jgi:TIR domain